MTNKGFQAKLVHAQGTYLFRSTLVFDSKYRTCIASIKLPLYLHAIYVLYRNSGCFFFFSFSSSLSFLSIVFLSIAFFFPSTFCFCLVFLLLSHLTFLHPTYHFSQSSSIQLFFAFALSQSFAGQHRSLLWSPIRSSWVQVIRKLIKITWDLKAMFTLACVEREW